MLLPDELRTRERTSSCSLVPVQERSKRRGAARSPPSLQFPHSSPGQPYSFCRCDRVTLGPKGMYALARVLIQKPFPTFDLREHEKDLLSRAQLPTPWIEPHEPRGGFDTDQHHVVVRRDDDLIGLSREGYDLVIHAATRGRSIGRISYMRRLETQHPERLRHLRAQQLVPEQPNCGGRVGLGVRQRCPGLLTARPRTSWLRVPARQ